MYRYRKNNKANDDKGDVVTPPETVPPLLREHVRRRIMKMELALQKTQSSYRIGLEFLVAGNGDYNIFLGCVTGVV